MAFLEQFIDFFPEPMARTRLRKIIAASRKLGGRILDRAEQVLEGFDGGRATNKLLQAFGILPSGTTPFKLSWGCG